MNLNLACFNDDMEDGMASVKTHNGFRLYDNM